MVLLQGDELAGILKGGRLQYCSGTTDTAFCSNKNVAMLGLFSSRTSHFLNERISIIEQLLPIGDRRVMIKGRGAERIQVFSQIWQDPA